METIFSNSFVESLKKHSALKKIVKKKVDMIIESPIPLGEPLRGNLRGYYSCPVKKNFLIIYLYCKPCRKKSDDKIVLCADCNEYQDETIRFVDMGPHDKIYKNDTGK